MAESRISLRLASRCWRADDRLATSLLQMTYVWHGEKGKEKERACGACNLRCCCEFVQWRRHSCCSLARRVHRHGHLWSMVEMERSEEDVRISMIINSSPLPMALYHAQEYPRQTHRLLDLALDRQDVSSKHSTRPTMKADACFALADSILDICIPILPW